MSSDVVAGLDWHRQSLPQEGLRCVVLLRGGRLVLGERRCGGWMFHVDEDEVDDDGRPEGWLPRSEFDFFVLDKWQLVELLSFGSTQAEKWQSGR